MLSQIVSSVCGTQGMQAKCNKIRNKITAVKVVCISTLVTSAICSALLLILQLWEVSNMLLIIGVVFSVINLITVTIVVGIIWELVKDFKNLDTKINTFVSENEPKPRPVTTYYKPEYTLVRRLSDDTADPALITGDY